MKKLFNYPLAALLFLLTVPMGCTKQSNDVQYHLPDISDFSIVSSTPFTVGSTSTVNVYCTTIGSGTYKVYFDLAGSNVAASQSASLVMYNSFGSFKTPVLKNAGFTFLTLNSITNANGGGTAFTMNNKHTLSDSTGVMTALLPGGGNFVATDISAVVTGSQLKIQGIVSIPSPTSITIYLDNYTHSNGTTVFSSHDVPEVASIQYQAAGGGGTYSAYGTIKINSIAPYLSGTFSFTGMDSTMISNGTFSAPTPQ